MKNAQPLNPHLFNIYLLFTRDPFVRNLVHELEYYCTWNKRLIGFIGRDKIDNDYSVVILSRDGVNQYRAERLQTDIQSIEEARAWIDEEMGSDALIQHENKRRSFDLFSLCVDKSQISPYFELLMNAEAYRASRECIAEVSYHYKDVDGNFIQQFQSINGFDARLWEIYLFCYCREEEFDFRRNINAPDYMIHKGTTEIAIEATIVSNKEKDKEKFFQFIIPSQEDLDREINNDMPIRFGGALFDKLKKKYWEKEHVAGKPLIFAIADFHSPHSMSWSFAALMDYLYGYRYKVIEENGAITTMPEQIEPYTKATGAKVPAGFFFLPDAENVSAIISNPTATLSKFNRLGKQAGLGSPNSNLIRKGIIHNHQNQLEPIEFRYVVSPESQETWAEGVTIYHNPNAKYSIDPSLFPSAAHHFFNLEEKKIYSIYPDVYPYVATTVNLTGVE